MIESGAAGAFALYGGIVGQFTVVLVLALLGGMSSQPLSTQAAALGLSIVIYFTMDITYVYCFEMRVLNFFYDAAAFPRPQLQRVILLPAFFLVACGCLSTVVILPALDEAGAGDLNLLAVALRGFLVGHFAYANLSFVNTWSFPRYPLEFTGMLPLSGGVLCCLTSLFTTLILKQL